MRHIRIIASAEINLRNHFTFARELNGFVNAQEDKHLQSYSFKKLIFCFPVILIFFFSLNLLIRPRQFQDHIVRDNQITSVED